MDILFVCTGNICRSPVAERLALAYSNAMQISGVRASSAGTRAVIGHPIHQEAARVLEGFGGNPEAFAARQLTAKIASSADIVLAMTQSHRDYILELVPHRLNRTFTLLEASTLIGRWEPRSIGDLPALRPYLTADEPLDIPDPIGGPPELFERVCAQISERLPAILELCRRTKVPNGETADRSGKPLS